MAPTIEAAELALERFAQFWGSRYPHVGRKLAATLGRPHRVQPRVATSMDGISQGLAWFICTDPSKQPTLRITRGSFGASGASGTFGWVDPGQRLIRVPLMQRFGGTDMERDTFMHLAAEVS